MMEHPDFQAAKFDTGFIDRMLSQLTLERRGNGQVEAAIAAAAILAFEESQQVQLPDDDQSRWKIAGREEAIRGLS